MLLQLLSCNIPIDIEEEQGNFDSLIYESILAID